MPTALPAPARASEDDCPAFVLRPLEWDSGHLGFAVAEITDPLLPITDLELALLRARGDGIALIYWRASPDHEVPAHLLKRNAGLLAARQVTFQRETSGSDPQTIQPSDVWIDEYPQGAASRALVDLAVGAGVCSRFRVDPRIPLGKFASLYETWMQRSTCREIADAVLVASSVTAPQDLLGVVTFSLTAHTGQIGLVAVAPWARRRGVGHALLAAARRRMADHGAIRVRVTTQIANLPACSFYESAGYTVADLTHIYHFWPLVLPGAADR